MNKHIKEFSFVSLTLALICQSCSSPEEQQHQAVLKVATLPFMSYAPLFIAQEEGYFEEQGLQVEFVRLNSYTAAVPALAQGDLDAVGGWITVNFLNAMAQGARLRFVSDKGYVAPPGGCSTSALMAWKTLSDSGELDRSSQLRGRRIAMDPVTIEGFYVEKLLSTVNLTSDHIRPLDIPTPAQLDALQKGTIDLAAMSEPWITRALRTENIVIWMPVEQIIPGFQFAFIVYGPNLLDKNVDAGKQFMVAYLKALRQYNQGKTERNLEILAGYTGHDKELLNDACWPPIRGDGGINAQSVDEFQAWAMEKGYLDRTATEDQFWDPRFVEYANQFLNTPVQ